MIGEVVKLITNAESRNCDFVDRLNHKYTSLLLVILGILVSTKQYVGDPIDCWTPSYFGAQWVQYTDTFCWVSNTYHLPWDIMPSAERRFRFGYEIKYYQWVPIMLVAQALMFFAPSLIWRAVSNQCVDMGNIVEATTYSDVVIKPSERDEVIKHISQQMDRFIKNRRFYRRDGLHTAIRKCCRTNTFFLVCGSRHGNLLGPVYLLTKALYLVNVYSQLFLLDTFLGPMYHAYGIEVMRALADGREWTNSRRFPTITLCDFPVRTLGNLQKYTVQCVLSINLFNERIYLCIWFLLLFVAIVTSVNLAMWVWRLCFRFTRVDYITKHLRLTSTIGESSAERRLVGQFVDQYLRHDGTFIFKLLAQNTNSLVISELISEVWRTFLTQIRKECRRLQCPDNVICAKAGRESKDISTYAGSIFRQDNAVGYPPIPLPSSAEDGSDCGEDHNDDDSQSFLHHDRLNRRSLNSRRFQQDIKLPLPSTIGGLPNNSVNGELVTGLGPPAPPNYMNIMAAQGEETLSSQHQHCS